MTRIDEKVGAMVTSTICKKENDQQRQLLATNKDGHIKAEGNGVRHRLPKEKLTTTTCMSCWLAIVMAKGKWPTMEKPEQRKRLDVMQWSSKTKRT